MSNFDRYRVCRFCKEGGYELLKYGTRHYAHAECGLKAQGPAFLDNFHSWQLAHNFPYFVAKKYGVEKRLEDAFAKGDRS